MSSTSAHLLSGPEKAAVLLLALRRADCQQLLSNLDPRQAAVLSDQLARAHSVDRETRRRVLAEFRATAVDIPGSAPEEPAPPCDHRAGTGPSAEPREAIVRPFDFDALERVSASSLRGSRAARPDPDLASLGELPVRCRAQLAPLPLALRDLQALRRGDVVLLSLASEAEVELVGGARCRLRTRLRSQDRHRAVEVLHPVSHQGAPR